MKAKAIILASVLLFGCQTSQQNVLIAKQHEQSLSSANQENEVKEFTDNTRESSPQWLKEKSGSARQNLWSFISDELKMKIPENTRIREQKRKILTNKTYLHDITLRAEPYMYWIVEQIKRRNMPMELVLLPIVESAFNPQATSSANAAGLWQIVPTTGRNYGLKQNHWYDGRRDVAASTTAALDMLQHLNRTFSGDWLLAVAAYNSGAGRVRQAIKTNRKNGKPTDFWALTLPRETTMYIPKMLALSDIVKHNKKYGVKLPRPDESRALARIELNQQIHLSQVAKMAGISLKKLKFYNSGYTRNITAPAGPHYIMLPKAHMGQFRSSLSEHQIADTKLTNVLRNDVNLASPSKYKTIPADTLP